MSRYLLPITKPNRSKAILITNYRIILVYISCHFYSIFTGSYTSFLDRKTHSFISNLAQAGRTKTVNFFLLLLLLLIRPQCTTIEIRLSNIFSDSDIADSSPIGLRFHPSDVTFHPIFPFHPRAFFQGLLFAFE